MSLIKRGGVTKGLGNAASGEEAKQDETTSEAAAAERSAAPAEQQNEADEQGAASGDATRRSSPSARRGGTTKGVGAKPSSPPAETPPARRGGTTKGVGARQPPPPADPSSSRRGDTTRGMGRGERLLTPDLDEDSTSTLASAERPAPESGQPEVRTRGDTTRGMNPPAGNSRSSRTKGTLDRSATGIKTGTRLGSEEIDTLAPGARLQDRYVIDGLLGVGGMSVVYSGRDTRFEGVARRCAIKEMYQRSPDSKTRMLNLRFFTREAGMLATLNHAAIPKVFDFFEEDGRMYLVLELVEGKDLEVVAEELPQLPSEERVANWAIQICDVLHYLHSHQPEAIVFRDMKPSNVMVSDGDRIVLVDFGIARVFETSNVKGTMIGTEGYASPEQFRGVATPVSDIYALGATLHQLLTGSDPRTETPFTFHERPICALNPTVSPEMEAIVNRALEYDMNARWQSAEEMKEAFLSVPGVASALGIESRATVAAPIRSRSTAPGTELVWSFTCEDELRSSPWVDNGLLLIGCYDTNLYALDVARGEFRWKFPTEGGISSSPGVWNDTAIIASEDGSVYGLDVRQGKQRWKFATGRAIRSSPRVEDRVIFIGSDDMHFYALDGLRGTVIWKYRAWQPFRSTACAYQDAVYIGCSDGFVYCLDMRNGGLRWKQRTQQPVVSTPTCSDGLIFVGSTDNHLYALDGQGGWPAWRFRTGNLINSSPCVVGARVVVGSSDGNLYAVEKKNGRLAWKFETGSQITSSPRHANGKIYFGAVDGCVYAVDAGSGQLAWKYPTEGPIVSSAAVVDDVVYIGSLDQRVYALKA